jgi:hypothetical protein
VAVLTPLSDIDWIMRCAPRPRRTILLTHHLARAAPYPPPPQFSIAVLMLRSAHPAGRVCRMLMPVVYAIFYGVHFAAAATPGSVSHARVHHLDGVLI